MIGFLRPLLLFTFLLYGVLLTSCTTDHGGKTDNFSIQQKDSLRFRTTFFEFASKNSSDDSVHSAKVTIHGLEAVMEQSGDISHPINRKRIVPFVNNLINKAIIEQLRWDVTTITDSPTIETLANAFIADYEKDRNQAQTNDSVSWQCSIDVSVEHNTEYFISLKVSSYIFTGGAHPLQTTSYYVVTTRTPEPKLLSLRDIIQDTATFKKAAELQLRTMYDIPLHHDLRKHGFIVETNSLPLTKNFSLTRRGITLYYNPYEISPYSMGAHQINLPYSAISHYLRRDMEFIL